jgi:hypothetical protein
MVDSVYNKWYILYAYKGRQRKCNSTDCGGKWMRQATGRCSPKKRLYNFRDSPLRGQSLCLGVTSENVSRVTESRIGFGGAAFSLWAYK